MDSLRYKEAVQAISTIEKNDIELQDLISSFQIFSNVYSPGSNTIHSVPAILGSNYPGDYDYRSKIIEKNVLFFSDIFRKNGFNTYAINTNPFLSSYFGYDKHFDKYVEKETKKTRLRKSSFIKKLKFTLNPKLPYFTISQINEKIKENMLPSKYQKNIFWIYYMDTHMPYNIGKGFWGNYKSKYIMNLARKENVSERSKRRIKDLYTKSVKNTLNELFLFLLSMQNKDLLEQTVVVITSDHGEEFWEHGLFGHPARHHYQENIHVPLLIFIPGFEGKKHENLISLLDLVPTLLDIFSVDTPHDMVGQTFLPLLIGKKGYQRKYAISETEIKSVNSSRLALITDRYKLIFNRELREFYDLKSDPNERKNIYDEKSDIVQKMENIGLNHISKHKKKQIRKEKYDIPSEVKSRLEALGYL